MNNIKLKIKTGDTVKVISGKDKGKRGEIIEIEKNNNLVRVRGVAIQVRHQRSKMARQKGRIDKIEAFLNASKVMPICSKTGKPCRVRTKLLESGKKVRVSHRSGAEL
jgi:large subunit ribosomal protein L24